MSAAGRAFRHENLERARRRLSQRRGSLLKTAPRPASMNGLLSAPQQSGKDPLKAPARFTHRAARRHSPAAVLREPDAAAPPEQIPKAAPELDQDLYDVTRAASPRAARRMIRAGIPVPPHERCIITMSISLIAIGCRPASARPWRRQEHAAAIAQVYLFGSLAKGGWAAVSGAEVIVVVRAHFRDVLERGVYRIPCRSISTDTPVHSQAQFGGLAARAGSFRLRRRRRRSRSE